MTLRTTGLDWLAQNAGSGGCFISSGVSYTDADGVSQSGGTKDVVTAFVVADMVGKQTATIIAGTNYNSFKSINDGYDLEMSDVSEAADREADGGSYPRYCVTGATVCTAGTRRCSGNVVQQCLADGSGWYDVMTCEAGYRCENGVCVVDTGAGDLPTTGPIEVTIGGGTGCAQGSPDVLLDTSGAYAYFKSDPYTYIGVGGIYVHNMDATCYAYFTWEAKIWDGHGYTACPTTTPEHQEINRYLAEAGERPLSLSRVGASETEIVWGSFEVPSTMEGEKTLCLSLWGNFDYQALVDELNAEGYYDKT